MKIAPMLALALIAAPVAAQDTPPESPAQSAAWHNLQQSALHSPATADGWATLEGGVRFRRVAGDGTGPAPTVRDIVSVNYTGSFADGEVFDSNEGSAPVTFPLGRLIRAWQVAIPYMGVGDSAEIVVPMEMGYGPQGGGPIPGRATLLFTIELVNITRPPGT